jgi:hypothetical protein
LQNFFDQNKLLSYELGACMNSWEQLLELYRLADAEYTEAMRIITDKLDRFRDGESEELPTSDEVKRTEEALKKRMHVEQKLSKVKK